MESAEKNVSNKKATNKKIILFVIAVIILVIVGWLYIQNNNSDDFTSASSVSQNFQAPHTRHKADIVRQQPLEQVSQWQRNTVQEVKTDSNNLATEITKQQSNITQLNKSNQNSSKNIENINKINQADATAIKSTPYSDIQNQIYLAKLRNTLLKVQLETKELRAQLKGQQNVEVQAITNINNQKSAVLIINGKKAVYHEGDSVPSLDGNKPYIVKSILDKKVVITNGENVIKASL